MKRITYTLILFCLALIAFQCSPEKRNYEKVRSVNTIDALALTCGFANRSSFSKVFKKSTGHSPGAYLQSIQKNS